MSSFIEHTFASDNYAGVHPEVMAAIVAANVGHSPAYGGDGDAATEELGRLVTAEFGEGALAFPVFNGTGANVISLAAACARWEAVICAETAHVHCDEGGAPEVTGGFKLWTLRCGVDGKLTPALLAAALAGDRGNVHRAQPGAVTIAQTTELGAVYTPDEVAALAAAAHAAGLLFHMDGARLSNAAAALGLPFRAFTTDAGVDVLSLGGSKIGGMAAEAIVLLPRAGGAPAPELVRALPFMRKSLMQLASKQRFIAAQLCALLRGGLCVRLAAHANAMAARLEAGVRAIPGVELPTARQANAVFPIIPAAAAVHLRKAGFRFYTWDEATGQLRWMCSWDTQERHVDALVDAVGEAMAAARAP